MQKLDNLAKVIYIGKEHFRKWDRGRDIPIEVTDTCKGVAHESLVHSLNGKTPLSRTQDVWSFKNKATKSGILGLGLAF